MHLLEFESRALFVIILEATRDPNVHGLMNGYTKRVLSTQQNIIWQAIRTNEVLMHAMTWLNFENIMRSERRRSLMTNNRIPCI